MRAIIRRLKSEKRGISNVLVVMLSLILITVIVANVILWSYQMNRFDWERTQETVKTLRAEPLHLQLENSNLLGTFVEQVAVYEWKFYPESYVLLNGTKHVSGTMLDLRDDDGGYMKFRSYPVGVTYYFATRETPYLVSSPQYSDYISLNFMAEDQSDYLVLGYIELMCSSTSHQARARFIRDSTVLAGYADQPRSITEVMSQMFAYTFKGTGSDVTFKWQIAVSSFGASVTALRGRIYAIRLDNLPNIEYTSIYENTEQTNMDNVWGDDQGDTYEITINPSTAGYYLIWASAKVESNSQTSSVSVRLNIDNGFEYIPYLMGGEAYWSYARITDNANLNEENCFAIMAVRQFAAGVHNIKFQIADTDNTPSVDWQYISLLAVRLTGVFEFYSASTVQEAQTRQTAPQTYTLLNIPSGKAGTYIVLGGITARGSHTNHEYATVLTIDDISHGAQQTRPMSDLDYVPKVFIQNITLDNNSHTVATKYYALNPAMTVYVKNSDVLAIRLPSTEQKVEVEFTGGSNLEDWKSLSWMVNCRCSTDNVATTFQLYRTGGYPNNSDGCYYAITGTNDATISQIITINCTSFRDPTTGTWKMKINAVKSAPAHFEFWVDYIELRAQSEGKTYILSIEGDFTLNVTKYSVENISTIEINIHFKASDTKERWILKAYNWMSNRYDEIDALAPALYLKDYTISLEGCWQDYINPSNGTLKLAINDETPDSTSTTININSFSIKATLKHGAIFTLKNEGAATVHIVAIWVITEKTHKRFSADFFINSGDTIDYLREDITLPTDGFIIKMVTERGNISIFSGD